MEGWKGGRLEEWKSGRVVWQLWEDVWYGTMCGDPSVRFMMAIVRNVIRLLVLGGLAGLMILGVIYEPWRGVREPGFPLRELSAIGELRAQFNRDAGKTRLILLLSPT